MPSDCQCSTACDVQTKYVEKVLNDKQATEKLKKLKIEIKNLKIENSKLKSRLSKATVNKDIIVKKLKQQLDRV